VQVPSQTRCFALTTGNSLQSSVFVPTRRSTCAPAPAGDPTERRRGDDVPVDHRLPQQHAGHRLGAPALRVRVSEKIGLELRLLRKQAVNGHRRNGLSGGLGPELVGEIPADPAGGRRRENLMSCPTLGDGTPETTLGARNALGTLVIGRGAIAAARTMGTRCCRSG
jgi:hypothetical protein